MSDSCTHVNEFPIQGSNSRTGEGEVLQFGIPTQQSIITGSKPTADLPDANRLVVAGQDGFTETGGEGGDIYLWAGRGGSSDGDGSSDGNGGDIKVDAGNGGGLKGVGGAVKIRSGFAAAADSGFIEISAGDSLAGNGGYLELRAGSTYASPKNKGIGGSVEIKAGSSVHPEVNSGGGDITLTTFDAGKIALVGSGGEFLKDSSNPDNQIATIGDITSKQVKVPASSLGQAGDEAHYVAIDASYYYLCTGAFDGETHIWRRISLSVDTWGT